MAASCADLTTVASIKLVPVSKRTLGGTLDDMIIGNQTTIVPDETPCRCGHFAILGTPL